MRSIARARRIERGWVALLVTLTAGATASIVLRTYGVEGDVQRFAELASAPGVPYRDFSSEFAPLETALIRGLFRADPAQVATRVSLLSLTSFVAIAFLVRRFWGPAAAATYALLVLPMQFFMPFRIDHVPTLLAVAAATAARDRDRVSAGALFGAAAGFKVWPLTLAPIVLRRGLLGPLALVVATALTVSGWLLVSGTAGIQQVGTFRGAEGWHIESTIGVAVSFVGPPDLRVETGAVRVGRMETWHLFLLGTVLLGVIAEITRRARRSTLDPAGVPAIAAVSALLVLAPVASPQYLTWLLPWIAIAHAEERTLRIIALALAAGTAASLSFIVYWGIYGGLEMLRALALVRVACTIGIAVIAFDRLRRADAAYVADVADPRRR